MPTGFRDPAFASNRSAPIHRWVPWIAGFSKHFIEDAISTYLCGHRQTVLDPCRSGTCAWTGSAIMIQGPAEGREKRVGGTPCTPVGDGPASCA